MVGGGLFSPTHERRCESHFVTSFVIAPLSRPYYPEKRLDPPIMMAENSIGRLGRHFENWGTIGALLPWLNCAGRLKKTHPNFYQRELARLAKLSSKVAAAYAQSQPETRDLDDAFQRFRASPESHIEREQRELFLAIRRLSDVPIAAGRALGNGVELASECVRRKSHSFSRTFRHKAALSAAACLTL